MPIRLSLACFCYHRWLDPARLASRGTPILDALVTRRKTRQKKRRRKSTRSLPIPEEALQTVLDTEARREEIEDRIGEVLISFRRVSRTAAPSPHRDPSRDLEGLRRALLVRESRFNSYLDVVGLLSETIALLSREVKLLRACVELPRDGPSSKEPRIQSAATEDLHRRVERAVKRGEQADLMLDRIGRRGDEARNGGF